MHMPGLLPACVLLGSLSASAADQRLLFQVVVPAGVPTTGLAVEVRRLGTTQTVLLTDDGTSPGDVPGDGVHTGWLDGRHAVLSQVVLRDGATVLYAGTDITTRTGVDRVGFALRTVGDRVEAIRAPASLPGAPGRLGAEAGRVAALGWGTLALFYVGGVLLWSRRQDP
jgi:hypothetical protein